MTVLRGEIHLSQPMTARLMHQLVDGLSSRSAWSGMESLSERELQVFEGIGCGMSTREIGAKHGISHKTVETYRLHLKRKLGLSDSNDVVHAAVRWVGSEIAGKTWRGQETEMAP